MTTGSAGTAYAERRRALERYVRSRVGRWQAGLLAADRSPGHTAALRELAELRRAPVDAKSGDFATLLTTLDGMPVELMGRGDRASATERAAHAALVLFATHQQSQRTAVHISPGDGAESVTLAYAAGRFARSGSEFNEGIMRRFKAIAAASTVEESLHHLAAFVGMLRSASPPIALDYGRLASDIHDLHTAAGRARVQLQWARAFHHVPTGPADETATATPAPTGDPT